MIVIVDNYDSFVHNLARYFREAGAKTEIVRNDAFAACDLVARNPAAVVLSPGPKAPREAGICLDLLKRLPATTPLLGVCLGHQCLVEAFGGKTVSARRPLHGEASPIRHDGAGVLKGLGTPLAAGLYHSLASIIPDEGPLVAHAWSDDGDLMAVSRRGCPWFGLQFHPESLLTPDGRRIVANFLSYTRKEAAA